MSSLSLGALPPSGWMFKPRSKIQDDIAEVADPEEVKSSFMGKGLFGGLRALGAQTWQKRFISIRLAPAGNTTSMGKIVYGKGIGQEDKVIPLESIRAANSTSSDTMRNLKAPNGHVDHGWSLVTEGKELHWAADDAEVRDAWVKFLQAVVEKVYGERQMTSRNFGSPPSSRNLGAGGNAATTTDMMEQAMLKNNNNKTSNNSNSGAASSAASPRDGHDDEDGEEGGASGGRKTQMELSRLTGGLGGDDDLDDGMAEYLAGAEDDDDYDDEFDDEEDDEYDLAEEDADEHGRPRNNKRQTHNGGGQNNSGGEQQSREAAYKQFLRPIAQTRHPHIEPSKVKSQYSSLFKNEDRPENVLFSRFMHKIAKRGNVHEREVVVTSRNLYLFAKGRFGKFNARVIDIDQIVGVVESTSDPSLFAFIVPSFHDILLKVTPVTNSHFDKILLQQTNNGDQQDEDHNKDAPTSSSEVEVKQQLIAHVFCAHLALAVGRPFLFRESGNIAAVIRRTEDDQHMPLVSKPGDKMRVASNPKIYPALRTNADSIVYFSCMVNRISNDRASRLRGFIVTDCAFYTTYEKVDEIARRTSISEVNRVLYDVNTHGVLFKCDEQDTLINIKDDEDFQTLIQVFPEVTAMIGHRIRCTASNQLFSNAQLVSTSKLIQIMGKAGKGAPDGAKMKKLLKKSLMKSVKGVGFFGSGMKNMGMRSADLLKAAGKGMGGVLVDNVITGELIGAMGAAGNALLQNQRFVFETVFTVEDEERRLAAHPPYPDKLNLKNTPTVAQLRIGMISYSSRCGVYNLVSHLDANRTTPRIIAVATLGLYIFDTPENADWKVWKGLFSGTKGSLTVDDHIEFSTVKAIVTCSTDPSLVGIMTNDHRHVDIMLRLPNATFASYFTSYLAAACTDASSPSIFSRRVLPVYSVPLAGNMKVVLKKSTFDPLPTIACRQHPLSDIMQLSTEPDIAEIVRRFGDNTILFSGLAWRLRNSVTRKGSDKIRSVIQASIVGGGGKGAAASSSAGGISMVNNREFKSFVMVVTNVALYMATKGGYEIVRRTDLRSITQIYLSSLDPDLVLLSVPAEYDILIKVEGRRKEFVERLRDAFLPWTDYGWIRPEERSYTHDPSEYFYPVTTLNSTLVDKGNVVQPPGFQEQQATQSAAAIASDNLSWFKSDLSAAVKSYSQAVAAATAGRLPPGLSIGNVAAILEAAVSSTSNTGNNASTNHPSSGMESGGGGGDGGGRFRSATTFFTGATNHASTRRARLASKFTPSTAPGGGLISSGGGSGNVSRTQTPTMKGSHAARTTSQTMAHSLPASQLWAVLNHTIKTAVTRMHFSYCRAYSFGHRLCDVQEMSMCAKLLTQWRELNLMANKLMAALASDNVEKYENAVKKAKGHSALAILIQSQNSDFEQLRRRQHTAQYVKRALEDELSLSTTASTPNSSGSASSSKRADVFILLTRAMGLNVSPVLLKKLVRRLDKSLQSERIIDYVMQCGEAVASTRRLQQQQQSGNISSGGGFAVAGGGLWTSAERQTLLDSCQQLGVSSGGVKRLLRSRPEATSNNQQQQPLSNTTNDNSDYLLQEQRKLDDIVAAIELLHYSIQSGNAVTLENAISFTATRCGPTVVATFQSKAGVKIGDHGSFEVIRSTSDPQNQPPKSYSYSPRPSNEEDTLESEYGSLLTSADVDGIVQELIIAFEEFTLIKSCSEEIAQLEAIRGGSVGAFAAPPISTPAAVSSLGHRIANTTSATNRNFRTPSHGPSSPGIASSASFGHVSSNGSFALDAAAAFISPSAGAVAEKRQELEVLQRLRASLLAKFRDLRQLRTGEEINTVSGQHGRQLRQSAIRVHVQLCDLYVDRIEEGISTFETLGYIHRHEQESQKAYAQEIRVREERDLKVREASAVEEELEQHQRREMQLATTLAIRVGKLGDALRAATSTGDSAGAQRGIRNANATMVELETQVKILPPFYADTTKCRHGYTNAQKQRFTDYLSQLKCLIRDLRDVTGCAQDYLRREAQGGGLVVGQEGDEENSLYSPNSGGTGGGEDSNNGPVVIPSYLDAAIRSLDKEKVIAYVQSGGEVAGNKLSTTVSATSSQPKSINFATLAEIRKRWAAATAHHEWVRRLHQSIHTAVSLRNAPMLLNQLDVAAERGYADEAVQDAKELYEVIRLEDERNLAIEMATKASSAASSLSPAKLLQQQKIASDNDVHGKHRGSDDDDDAVAAPQIQQIKPRVEQLSTAYDPQGQSTRGRVLGQLFTNTLVILKNTSESVPTEEAFSPDSTEEKLKSYQVKLIEVPEDNAEVKVLVHCIVALFEHGVKPSGIFKKIPRTIYDVLKTLGDVPVPNGEGTLAAPYTNRLISDFDRIKRLNNPGSHTEGYLLGAYLLFRNCLLTVLTEILSSVPPKSINDLFIEEATFRKNPEPGTSSFHGAPSPYSIPPHHKDLIAIAKMLDQVKWGFTFTEKVTSLGGGGVMSKAALLRRTMNTELASSNSNNNFSSSPNKASLASVYSAATGGATEGLNSFPLNMHATQALTSLKASVMDISKYFSAELASLTTAKSKRGGGGGKGTNTSSAMDAQELLDERRHKGIGIVIRESFCPALAHLLQVGYRSSHYMTKRHLWDLVVAVGARLRQSSRSLSAMHIPDGVDLVLSMTDLEALSDAATRRAASPPMSGTSVQSSSVKSSAFAVLQRLSETELKDLRLRMFICHLLNSKSLMPFIEAVFLVDDVQDIVSKGVYPHHTNPSTLATLTTTSGSSSSFMPQGNFDAPKHVPLDIAMAAASTPHQKDVLQFLDKYYHLDRCLLLAHPAVRTAVLRLVTPLNTMNFSLCVDAEIW